MVHHVEGRVQHILRDGLLSTCLPGFYRIQMKAGLVSLCADAELDKAGC